MQVAPSASTPRPLKVRGRWEPGSIVSILLALVLFCVLALWLSPLWLLLPIIVFAVQWWRVGSRERTVKAVRGRTAHPVRDARVVDAVTSAAASMNIPIPEVLISPLPARNAFAMTDRQGGLVCIFQGALDVLEDDELAAVLAHEVGHIKNRDSLYMVFFETVRQSLLVLVGFVAALVFIAATFLGRGRDGAALGASFWSLLTLVGSGLAFVLLAYGQRSREYGADRLCTATQEDPLALGRALIRLSQTGDGWNLGEVPASVAARCIVPPYASGFVSGIISSHPSTKRRIARIERWVGQTRTAELRTASLVRQWERRRVELRHELHLAMTAAAEPLRGQDLPFVPKVGEGLWYCGPATLVKPTTVRGVTSFVAGGSGTLHLTTTRAVFTDLAGKVEWQWSKLYDQTVMQADDGATIVMAVQNRQRASGIWVDAQAAKHLLPIFEVALSDYRGTRSTLVSDRQNACAAHEQARPTLGAPEQDPQIQVVK